MGHAPHKKIHEIADLGIIKVFPKRIPHLNLPCLICLIVKSTHLIHQPTFRNDDVPIGTRIQADSIFFNSIYIRGFT